MWGGPFCIRRPGESRDPVPGLDSCLRRNDAPHTPPQKLLYLAGSRRCGGCTAGHDIEFFGRAFQSLLGLIVRCDDTCRGMASRARLGAVTVTMNP
jgi:hypothetical protein